MTVIRVLRHAGISDGVLGKAAQPHTAVLYMEVLRGTEQNEDRSSDDIAAGTWAVI